MLIVMKQVYPENIPAPFRIVETYNSIDGPRARLSPRSFSSEEEAVAFAKNPEPEDFVEL